MSIGYATQAGFARGSVRRGRPFAKRRRVTAAARFRPRRGGTDLRTRTKTTLPELKFHDQDVDDAVVAAGINVASSLLTIPEGNGEEQRVGRKIVIKKIAWRFDLELPTTATAGQTSDTVRVMLVLDKQCNGALPTATNVLKSAEWQSFNNLSNSMRFTVLYDKLFAINCQAGSGRGSTDTLSWGVTTITDSFYKECDIRVEYDNSATTGVITSIRSNNLVVLLGSRRGFVSFSSKMRIRFND